MTGNIELPSALVEERPELEMDKSTFRVSDATIQGDWNYKEERAARRKYPAAFLTLGPT
jgi:hypothetical protein